MLEHYDKKIIKSGSLRGWFYKNSPIPIYIQKKKKSDSNDHALRSKLPKAMNKNYYGELVCPMILLYIFLVVILGTITCNIGLAAIESSMNGEPANPFATPLKNITGMVFLFHISNDWYRVQYWVFFFNGFNTCGIINSAFFENVNKFQNPFCRPIVTIIFFNGIAAALWLGIGAKLP